MKTSIHLLVSFILAAALYPLFNWKVFLIIIGGVLIDVDHYLWYICKFKKFNMSDCRRCFAIDAIKNNFKDVTGELLIFHTIEFMLISVLLSFYIEFVSIFTIGLLVHYLMDLMWYYSVPKRFVLNHSIISWVIKNKIQKV